MGLGIPTEKIVQLYLNGAWVDITADTRGAIDITRGFADGSKTLTPTRITFKINNRDGKYSPRNPTGTYYGQLVRGTPVRVLAGYAATPAYRSVATATATAATSITCAPPAGTTAGDILIAYRSTDAVNAYSVYPPVGGGGPWRELTRINDGSTSTVVYWKRANASEPANYTFTHLTYGGNISITIVAVTGGIDRPIVTTSTSDSSSASASTPSADPYRSDDLELRYVSATGNVTWTSPGGMTERADFTAGASLTATLATVGLASTASTGTKTFTSSGNTTVRRMVTVIVSARSVRGAAEVVKWPQEWLPGGVDVWVPIQADGYWRRLSDKLDGRPAYSAVYRDYAISHSPVLYWPMEDAASSTQFAPWSTTSPTGALTPGGGTTTLATNTSAVGSGALPKFGVGAQPAVISGGSYSPSSTMVVTWIANVLTEPAGTVDIFGWASNGTAVTWKATITPGAPATLALNVYDISGTNLYSGSINFTDSAGNELFGTPVKILVQAVQSGSNIALNWELEVSGYIHSVTTSFTGTIGYVFEFSRYPATVEIIQGHTAVYNTTSAPGYEAIVAYTGEESDVRMARLASEEGISFIQSGISDPGIDFMGIQATEPALTLIQQCADADTGMLFEARHSLALFFRPRLNLYNQNAVAFSYSSSHLSDLQSVEDDRLIENDVTVTRTPNGSSARSVLTSGTLSTAAPPNGVGDKPVGYSLNLAGDSSCAPMANWIRSQGTIDAPRFSTITVELSRAPYVASTTLSADALALDLGDRVTASSLPVWLPPDGVNAIVRNCHEVIDSKTHTITWGTNPADVYQVGIIDDTATPTPRFDSTDTTLLSALTSGATSAKFAVTGDNTRDAVGWSTTNTPYDVTMAGERVTVTAMAAPAMAFVAAGTVANANNASVTPGLPAGLAADDLLLVFAAIRNSGTGTVDTPSGYTQLLSFGNMALLGKIASGSESAPTITFTGGAAGADTTAQTAAFRGAQLSVLASSTLLNGSAANIAYPALDVQRTRSVTLYLGWRQSSWTSVAALSGATKIGDLTTSLGSGQGLIWEYAINGASFGNALAVAAGSLVVTGGVTAVSRGVVLTIPGDIQTATLTRAVNGVAKAQAAATSVRMFNPIRLAL